jgi:hypothetical protein
MMHPIGVYIVVGVPMLLGLPLLGLWWAGKDLSAYLEFPPVTRYVVHEPFSWMVFSGMSIFVLVMVLPFAVRWFRARSCEPLPRTWKFPWWGYGALTAGVVFWILAWSRFSWFEAFQEHTFTPLWLCYILSVNALSLKRSGSCTMLEKPLRFLALFPFSAAFWWFFEYLNRFVQNWYYVEVQRFSSMEYFSLASLSFSTVLPAVMSTRELVLTSPSLQRVFTAGWSVRPANSRIMGFCLLTGFGIGLALIGVLPNVLYPLLWVSPLVIIVSLQAIMEESHILSPTARGDWRLVVSSTLAALICGWFWEMWNYFSLAKWAYSVPYVQRFLIFEMPLIGFAGYLPFGLECAVIGQMILEREDR